MKAITASLAAIRIGLVGVFLTGCSSRNVTKANDYIRVGMYKEAIQLLDAEVICNPKKAEAFYLLGRCHLHLGNEGAARESFDRASRANRRYRAKVGDAYYVVASVVLAQGDIRGASRLMQRGKEEDPGVGPKAGTLFFKKGNELARNRAEAGVVVSHFKECCTFDMKLRESVADVCLSLAKDLQRSGDVDSCRTYAECSLTADPDHIGAVAKLYCDIASWCASNGRFSEAPPLVARAQQLSGDTTTARGIPSLIYKEGVESNNRGDKKRFMQAFGVAQKLCRDYEGDAEFRRCLLEYQRVLGKTPMAGLVAYYPFDGNAQDSSENGNHGVVFGAILTADRFGRSGAAYRFDGDDDYIDCGNGDRLMISGPFTISAWVKLGTLALHEQAIVSKGATPSEWAQYGLTPVMNDGRIGLSAGKGFTGDKLHSKSALRKDSWHHVLGVYRGGETKQGEIWIDGVLDATGLLDDPGNTVEHVYIGRCRAGGRSFQGDIDEVRIYDRGLSQDEIRSLCELQEGSQETPKRASRSGGEKGPRTSEAVPPVDRSIDRDSGGPDYVVVDLAGGPSASKYPVSCLTAIPSGGWTDEYRTTRLVLRRIPSGAFTMGSPADELGHGFDEVQHPVTLTRPFYLGVFEVTQKQWEQVMGTWPSRFNNPAYRDYRPVEQVSYRDVRGANAGGRWPEGNSVDADSFMGCLRARTGLLFDLPTEAQWEYAGRAGTTTSLNSGKNLADIHQCANMADVGRYQFNGGAGTIWSKRDYDASVGTAKVGSYQPNAWGLYDIHGNVYEWCLDWEERAPGAAVDPKGPSESPGGQRVYRGGGAVSDAYFCRAAHRRGGCVDARIYWVGFRVALPVVDFGLLPSTTEKIPHANPPPETAASHRIAVAPHGRQQDGPPAMRQGMAPSAQAAEDTRRSSDVLPRQENSAVTGNLVIVETVVACRDPEMQRDSLVVSPDAKRLAYRTGQRGPVLAQMYGSVVVDGRKGKTYRVVGDLRFSPNSRRVFYTAQGESGLRLVVDDAETRLHSPWIESAMPALHFSPDGNRWAYSEVVDRKKVQWAVTVDGRKLKNYCSVQDIVFSLDGKHLAYVARLEAGGGVCVVVDEQEGPVFRGWDSAIAGLAFSANGRVGYVARASGDYPVLIVDGQEKARGAVCGPFFSPDGKRFAYLLGDPAQFSSDGLSGKRRVVLDGQEGKLYDDVENESLVFSVDGARLAYVAIRGFRSGERPFGAPDYSKGRPGKRFVVVDGREGQEYDGVKKGTLRFLPSSDTVVYVAFRNGKSILVAGQQESVEYDRIEDGCPVVTPDGRHAALVMRRKSADGSLPFWVVVDGKEEGPYQWVKSVPVFSPDGGRVAYAVRLMNSDDWTVVVDGHLNESCTHVGLPVFSPDGRHVAYAVRGGHKATGDAAVVVDSQQTARYDKILADGKVVFDRPDRLHFMAQRGDEFILVHVNVKR